jgi:hypothetical protein
MILKTTSDEARKSLLLVLGRIPQYYYTVAEDGRFIEVNEQLLVDRALKITGITAGENQNLGHYLRCWDKE